MDDDRKVYGRDIPIELLDSEKPPPRPSRTRLTIIVAKPSELIGTLVTLPQLYRDRVSQRSIIADRARHAVRIAVAEEAERHRKRSRLLLGSVVGSTVIAILVGLWLSSDAEDESPRRLQYRPSSAAPVESTAQGFPMQNPADLGARYDTSDDWRRDGLSARKSGSHAKGLSKNPARHN